MIENTKQISEQTYSFLTTEPISQQSLTYSESNQAQLSPLGRKLFGFPWVASLKIEPQNIELTKQEWVDWDTLLEPLKGLINEHFEEAQRPIEENPTLPDEKDSLTSDEAQKLTQFIKDQVNPSLAMHGGWAELKGLENGKAFIQLGGGCQGCGMSQATLTEGIATAVKENFPTITEVVDVTDHASGANPYYS